MYTTNVKTGDCKPKENLIESDSGCVLFAIWDTRPIYKFVIEDPIRTYR